MPIAANITNQRFHRLVALQPVRIDGERRWKCLCDCGTIRIVPIRHLRNGNTKSCGCLQRDVVRMRSTIHGATAGGKRTRTYRIWKHMTERCRNPKTREWKYWGGRGITVCPEWEHDFPRFLSDMGPCPDGCSIDRFPNNNGNYEPGNCRWATPAEQTLNRRPRGAQSNSHPTSALPPSG